MVPPHRRGASLYRARDPLFGRPGHRLHAYLSLRQSVPNGSNRTTLAIISHHLYHAIDMLKYSCHTARKGPKIFSSQ
jgi:hypothetical protein